MNLKTRLQPNLSQYLKAWWLMQLFMGKWAKEKIERMKSEREARLQSALKLVAFVEQSAMMPKQIKALESCRLSDFSSISAKIL